MPLAVVARRVTSLLSTHAGLESMRGVADLTLPTADSPGTPYPRPPSVTEVAVVLDVIPSVEARLVFPDLPVRVVGLAVARAAEGV